MENQETVNPDADVEVTNEAFTDQPQEAQEVEREDTMVPLHAVQKERRRRQEAEQKLQFYEQQNKQESEANDESRYESATKEDLGKTKRELKREIQEETWAQSNPDLYRKVTDDLPEFLKLRPNLASAIEGSTNRYQEAWELMSKLSPKQTQQQQAAQKPKQQTPGSPSGVPKSTAMGESLNLMNMSDTEFNAWRREQRGKR